MFLEVMSYIAVYAIGYLYGFRLGQSLLMVRLNKDMSRDKIRALNPNKEI